MKTSKFMFLFGWVAALLFACTLPARSNWDVTSITAGLPWKFTASDPINTAIDPMLSHARTLEYVVMKSQTVVSGIGDKLLQVDYKTAHYGSTQDAALEFEDLVHLDSSAELGVDWNMLLLRNDKLHWLKAQCGIKKDDYRKLYSNFLEYVSTSTAGEPKRIVLCECGESCAEIMINK